PLLAAGLCMVDTPGVGGLTAAYEAAALASLQTAAATLFVVDASAELGGQDIEFIRLAASRCPRVICVLTKIDLHPQWRRILELDRAHLGTAGLALSIFPTSATL